MGDMMLLETSGLKCHFGGIKAVDGVDFSIGERGVRAIIGPNGAGKSTFVGLLSGRIAATAGTVRFRGQDISRLAAWRRVNLGIAYTFQITNIYSGLTVRDNAAIAVESHLKRTRVWPGLEVGIREALSAVSLLEMADEKAGELAYGHQRLLEVAMGLALKPELLILDEPTQGLSDSEIANFCALVKAIAADASVLLIEHNMDVVMELADRITVMERGKILAEGAPEEIRSNAAVQAAYLGTPA
jgi:branched-chain amino acid transport system ATP-binding protein